MTETEYGNVRRKLAFFFRQNGCLEADAQDLIADSVLRVIRKEHDGTEIKELVAYAFGVAKHVLYEYRARPETTHCAMDGIAETATTASSDTAELELRDQCFTKCFEELSARNKKVIKECLQTTPPLSQSLRVRKHRIVHAHLMPCMHRCTQADSLSADPKYTGVARG